MVNGKLHHRFCRVQRLDKHSSAAFGAPRTASRLAQQLVQLFCRAKIGNTKSRISTDDSNKLYAREIVAFSDHLRSKQNVVFAISKRCQDFFDGTHVLRRIAVHANHFCRGNPLQNFFFEFFNCATDKFISIGPA